MSYVVDASVAIKWFVTEDLHEHALTLFDQPETLIAPDLICLEIANVAWKKAKRARFHRIRHSSSSKQTNAAFNTFILRVSSANVH